MKKQIVEEITSMTKEQLKETLNAIERIKKRNTTNDDKPFEYNERIIYNGVKAIVKVNEGDRGIVKLLDNDWNVEIWEWECDGEVCKRI